MHAPQLNAQQRQAIEHISSPLLVLAGAGSGKTSVITQKILYLLNKCGYQAHHITAVTFTNKAAREMSERIKSIKGDTECRGLTITTFHSLGLKILREEAHHLDYKKNFSILDSYDAAKIIADIINTTDRSLIRTIQSQISLWKNQLISPDMATALNDPLTINTALVYRNYQDTLKTYQAVDFDDLINLPLKLFQENLEVLYKWQQKIRYLLVDEYQDTNHCQYELIKLLCARDKMLTVVGDDDQSIYAWRGASIENIKNLEHDFKTLKVVPLSQNYRSTGTILQIANNLIQNNPRIYDKKLWSKLGNGTQTTIISATNEEEEAQLICRKIRLGQLRGNSKFADFAILYRSNYQARVLEETLRELKLPYVISGGQSFFDKAEIKDILAYLRLIINDEDDIAFIRAVTTPKRGVGQVTLDKLVNYAKMRNICLFAAMFEEGFITNVNNTQLEALHNFGNFINDLQFRANREDIGLILNELLSKIDYERYLYDNEASDKSAVKKWNNILSFVTYLTKIATTKERNLTQVVQNIMLISILDSGEKNEVDAISLSTLHAAKGLEYRYVYLIGCEEGILPHQESLNSEFIEEERRLMYVGITRAKEELTISYCQERRSAGELRKTEPSRFLDEMGSDLVINEAKKRQSKINDTSELQDRLNALKNLLQN